MSNLVDRLLDEADLCRNDGATDIAILLEEAAGVIKSCIIPCVCHLPRQKELCALRNACAVINAMNKEEK